MTENELFALGGPETQLHDILWSVHDGKNRGRSEGEENFGEFPVKRVVGAERCTEVCNFLLYTYARVREALLSGRLIPPTPMGKGPLSVR